MAPATRFLRAAFPAAALLLAPAAALACTSCKEAVASQGDAKAVMSGYEASIYLMLSMPFALLGTLGVLLWRAVREGKRRAAEAAAARAG